MNLHDLRETVPVDNIKSFCEVELKNQCGHFPLVAHLQQLRGINKILSDRPAFEETSLVQVNQPRDFPLQACSCEDLRSNLDTAILQTDWPECIHSNCSGFLGKQDHVGAVYSAKINCPRIKTPKELHQRLIVAQAAL